MLSAKAQYKDFIRHLNHLQTEKDQYSKEKNKKELARIKKQQVRIGQLHDWDLHMDREKVYFSSHLKKKLPKFYKMLKDQVELQLLEYTEIEKSNDIWVRDYMPVDLGWDEYIQFEYNPSYLKGYDELKTDPEYCLPDEVKPKKFKLIVDGGNLVIGDHHVILTDQVFAENHKKTKKEVLSQLEKAFPRKEIVIVPKEPGDLFGHSDGMIRFKDSNTVIVNNYMKAGVSESYISKLFGALAMASFDIVQCPYYPEDRQTKHNVPSASGNYINYLETRFVIFVPQFGSLTDEMAMEFFKSNFRKTIVGVDCSELAEHGGLLNCISWNKVN